MGREKGTRLKKTSQNLDSHNHYLYITSELTYKHFITPSLSLSIYLSIYPSINLSIYSPKSPGSTKTFTSKIPPNKKQIKSYKEPGGVESDEVNGNKDVM